MKFDEFKDSLRKDIEDFVLYWVENNEAEPDDFPMELGAADWYEQFISWISTDD